MGSDNMILNSPITKRVTLDTNADLIGEADNLFIEVMDELDGTVVVETPTFTEIVLNTIPTGIYIADLDFATTGKFLVEIKHSILDRSGSTSVIISADADYETLEQTVYELGVDADQVEESSSFA